MPWMNCTINLNSDSTSSFYTGDIVTGLVVLELEKDQKIERIDLKVMGTCKASWTRSTPTLPYIKIYSEKKQVLCVKINDIFREVSHGNIVPAGVHRHPFHFALPSDLPSTFESSLAKTQYYIKVKSKPAYKLRKVAYFRVLGNVNLNHLQEMLDPCFQEVYKKNNSADNFGIAVKTYRAFAPKQTVPFEVTINNEKKIKIKKLKISLMQNIRYTVSSGYADETKSICKLEYKKFSYNIAEICFMHMEIPQIIPSSLQVIDPMIAISYSFRIDVIFSLLTTISKELPVTVASVPVIHSTF